MHILAEKLAILAAKLGASGQRFESRTRHQSAKSCQCSGGVDQIPPNAKDAAKPQKKICSQETAGAAKLGSPFCCNRRGQAPCQRQHRTIFCCRGSATGPRANPLDREPMSARGAAAKWTPAKHTQCNDRGSKTSKPIPMSLHKRMPPICATPESMSSSCA